MINRFAEYRDVRVTDPLRQGDVIEATDPSASIWQRHLLVITADCDFANDKTLGWVTCVPILSQDDYLMQFQIPRIRDRVVAKIVAALQDMIASVGGPRISQERLREWPLEQEPTEIVKAMGLTEPQSDNAVSLFVAIRNATLLPNDLDSAVKHLVAAQVEVPSGKKTATARREVIDTLRAHYTKPPGDALFLSGVAPSLEAGYFVYLRHLEQIPEPEIAIAPQRHPTPYRRLSRLQDRFIHAVTQQFGLLFMAIGLPHEYEELRDLHSKTLGERYN